MKYKFTLKEFVEGKEQRQLAYRECQGGYF